MLNMHLWFRVEQMIRPPTLATRTVAYMFLYNDLPIFYKIKGFTTIYKEIYD